MPARRIRFTIGSLMVATGVFGLAMGLGRIHPGLGVLAPLGALGVLLLTTRGGDGRRVARTHFGRQAFCYVAGVVAPVLCLIFDPVVFRGYGGPAGGMFGVYRPGAYAFMAIEMTTMIAWLWSRESFGQASAVGAGAMWAGAFYAIGLGLLMLPLSAIGLVAYGLGLLGFTPFFTGVAFAMQALLATGDAGPSPRRGALAARLVLGAMLAIGPAVLAQWLIST